MDRPARLGCQSVRNLLVCVANVVTLNRQDRNRRHTRQNSNRSNRIGATEMWNTGCHVIYNRTPKRLLYVVDGEDQSRTLLIAPGDEASFKGTIFPWADRDD